jgi:hypothetical protein
MNAAALRRLIEALNGRPMTREERAVLARFLLKARNDDAPEDGTTEIGGVIVALILRLVRGP